MWCSVCVCIMCAQIAMYCFCCGHERKSTLFVLFPIPNSREVFNLLYSKQKKTCWGWSACRVYTDDVRAWQTLYSSCDEAGAHRCVKRIFSATETKLNDVPWACGCVCVWTNELEWQKFEGGHNHVIIYVSSSTLPFLLLLLLAG